MTEASILAPSALAPDGGDQGINGFFQALAQNVKLVRVPGGYLALWQQQVQGGPQYVMGQLFDLDNNRIGDEFTVSGPLVSGVGLLGGTLLDNGSVVVSWTDRTVSNDWQVEAAIVTLAGAGPEFVLSTNTNGNQYQPTVEALTGGGFAAVWANLDAEGGPAGSGGNIKLQLFDDLGGKLGAEILVNTVTAGSQILPSIARLSGGGFVVVWMDRSEGVADLTVSDWVIKAQLFDAAGNKSGGEFRVNSVVDGDQTAPQVAGLSTGGFVVTWSSSAPPQAPLNTYDIRAQVFTAAGAAVGTEFTANTATLSQQLTPKIQALRDGGFVIAWEDQSRLAAGGDTVGSAVRAQMFDGNGTKKGAEQLVNAYTDGSQNGPSIVLLDSGDLAFGWTSAVNYPWGFGVGVHSRLFSQMVTGTDGAEAIDLRLSDATDAAGLGGNDVLIGDEYRNTLDGGAGDDNMAGGLGDDIYVVDTTADVVTELSGEGEDEVRTGTASYTLGEHVERLTGLSAAGQTLTGNGADNQITGSGGNDILNGGAGFDWLIGGAGNDRLDGGTGGDEMAGGTGDDVYVIDHVDDTAFEADQEGNDRVETTLASYKDVWGVETIVGLLGTGQTLTGGFGPTTIIAGAGNDVLDGGHGLDTLQGGLGDDKYLVEPGDIIVEAANGGTDEAVGYNFTLPANVEKLSGAGALIGNGLDNVITVIGNSSGTLDGGGGNDTLVGGGGFDQLTGGAGADSLYGGGDVDYFYLKAAGDSTAAARDRIYDFQSGVDKLHVTGLGRAWATLTSATDAGTGATYTLVTVTSAGGTSEIRVDGIITQFDVIDSVIRGDAGINWINGTSAADIILGFGGNDRLSGNEGDDELDGGEGNDELIGDLGSDTLRGGTGDDTYWYVTDADTVIEAAGEGNDEIVVTGGVYSLANLGNIERLRSTGASAATLTGNGLANVIVGSGFADRLDGAGGDDRMEGGMGDDVYVVDNADTVVEAAYGGIDTVESSVTFTLPESVERLILTGDGNVSGIGNNDHNELTGNSGINALLGGWGNDRIDGGLGNDNMQGGMGDDVYFVGEVGDYVGELAGEGTDEVRTALGSRSDFTQMYTLAANVENLTGTSATGQGVYGNALDNVITMGAGADLVVLQDGGNDLVSGGGGDDFLYWGAAFTNADKADGGAGFDTVGLLGAAPAAFDADDFVSIEKVAVYSSGNAAAPNSYSLVMHDGNVAAGQQLMVVAQSLLATEVFTFNGAAELDGNLLVRGGRAGDTITGGAKGDTLWGGLGADTLRGGLGNDVFQYEAVGESTLGAPDTILDFTKGDKINLSPIDADGNAANGDSRFSFIGAAAFTGQAGQLRVTQHPTNGQTWVVEADVNGDGAADFMLYFVAPAGFVPEKSDFYV